MQISISNSIGGGGGAQGATPTPSFASTKSFLFDGSTDFIDCSSSIATVSSDNEGTISVWVKPTALTGNQNYITLTDRSQSGVYLVIGHNTTYNLFVQLRNGWSTTGFLLGTDTSPLSVGVWTHIALVQDGVSAVIYVNGVAVPQTFAISNYPQKWMNDFTINEFNIGKLEYSGGSINFTDGNLDEFSYFNTALSSSDILSVYNLGVPASLTLLSPVIWYRMGEEASWDGVNWTLTDQGSGGNDGTSSTLPAPPTQPSTDVPT